MSFNLRTTRWGLNEEDNRRCRVIYGRDRESCRNPWTTVKTEEREVGCRLGGRIGNRFGRDGNFM